ncbi:hypothetical protein [Ruminococcus sp.]|uniref:hypothetical protein n=1 Tax=Ruminococcus sp. TaxID=41978 RepID=UPI0022E2904B
MKKIIILAFITMIVCSSCGKSEQTTSIKVENAQSETTTSTYATWKPSFNPATTFTTTTTPTTTVTMPKTSETTTSDTTTTTTTTETTTTTTTTSAWIETTTAWDNDDCPNETQETEYSEPLKTYYTSEPQYGEHTLVFHENMDCPDLHWKEFDLDLLFTIWPMETYSHMTSLGYVPCSCCEQS